MLKSGAFLYTNLKEKLERKSDQEKGHIMKYKTIEEINKNPVWIKLQSNGTDKEQLDKQFLSLTEDEKIVAIDLFESLKVVMENVLTPPIIR